MSSSENLCDGFKDLKVVAKTEIAQGIFCFELADPQGASLPAFTAGAHLRVKTPSGSIRNYSLSNDPQERNRYVIAVKRDANGRGGSVSMTDDIKVGDSLPVAPPHNEFELTQNARKFIFVAGGIGITPILSMMRHLKASTDIPFKLYYCTRNLELTAFRDELEIEFAGSTVIHHDLGNPADAYDFWPVFDKPSSGTHVYCCGPRPLMDSVLDMTGHWPPGSIHFESFGVDQSRFAENRPFLVTLERSGIDIEIPADRSILEVLRDNGIRAPSSCESGTCGSCRTRLITGDVEHRDMVLREDEQQDQIMICVSRARGDGLVLDL
ncbi:PDR/VanB family oxidoreductase [Pseudomonas luteola]|uniref:PDR/VanB family oxidoreductase n=1 Tax=Pseudomonas luteola TaxID=47886 RepID=UPI00123B8B18|nr:PDR/VanB family oxidoreductase [Pseudomonas luteola]QEU26749.1 oxidoreductase [Pseudomonas luteola]